MEDLRRGWTRDIYVECAGFADGVKYGASFIPSNLAARSAFLKGRVGVGAGLQEERLGMARNRGFRSGRLN